MGLYRRLGDLLRPARRAGLVRCGYRLQRIFATRLLNPYWLGPRLSRRPGPTGAAPLPPPIADVLRLIAATRASASHDRWDPEQGHCVLLNQPGFPLLQQPSGQPAPCADPLWRTRLDEFDWAWTLVRDGSPDLRRLITAWWQAQPLGRGFAWNPYACSRRLIVWSAAIRLHRWDDLLPLLWRTASYLAHNLERDLDNNHLLANLKALTLFDLLCPGLRPAAAAARTRQALLHLLQRHVLPDGGHFERSSSYHLATWLDALETLLCLEAAGHELPAAARATVARMADFAAQLTTPTDQLPMFGDAVLGEPLPLEALRALHRRLLGSLPEPATGSRVFADTGYAVLRKADTTLYFDCGDLGPDHCPGHGHADILAIELWHGHLPVLVDCGTYQYAAGPKRDAYRGTLGHNTATVDDQDQARFVGPFRIAELAHARLCDVGLGEDRDQVEAEHDGYLRLPASVRHRRRVALDRLGNLTLCDRFEGVGRYRVTLSFHFAPHCQVVRHDGGLAITLADGHCLRLALDGPGQPTLEPGTYSPSWFQEQPILVARYVLDVLNHLVVTTRLTALSAP